MPLTTSRADINNDGQIDLSDYFAFFNAWDVSGPDANLDGDAEISLNDYFLFFNLFDAG